jgi:nucleoside-diphosphate-sugar epimerase
MRILVLGASGYIGKAFVERAVAAGHAVTGLVRSDAGRQEVAAVGGTAAAAQLGDTAAIAAHAAGHDAVLIAVAVADEQQEQSLRQAIRAAAAALPAQAALLLVSATAVYGSTDGTVTTEQPDSPPAPLAPKRKTERMVLSGLPGTARGIVVRPTLVYGRGGSGPVLSLIEGARRLGESRHPAAAGARWSTVHVDDLVDLLLEALERAPAGTALNAASETVPLVAVAEAVAEGLGGVPVAEVAGDELAEVPGPAGYLLQLSQSVSGQPARDLLDWSPAAPSLLHELAYGSYRS